MMDDLLGLDFNILDDDLLSFPMDEFNPIESREIENILNEIEHSTNEKIFMNPFTPVRPTIMFNNNGNANHHNNRNHHTIKTNKKSKSKVIGTSLLAKPPKKMKKDKNSLLSRNSSTILTANSLLNGNAGNRHSNSVICSASFKAYFFEEHNYCFNSVKKFNSITKLTSNKSPKEPLTNNNSSSIDLNNNLNSLISNQDKQSKSLNNCLTIETKEVDSSNQVLKKKNNGNHPSTVTTLNLISPNNMFNSDCETVHDLDDYFNISFTNSEESSDSTSNHSETEDDHKFDLESEMIKSESNNKKTNQMKVANNDDQIEDKDANVQKLVNELVSKQQELTKSESISIEPVVSNDSSVQIKVVNVSIPALTAQTTVPATHNKQQTLICKQTPVKNIIIDDINNYNINEINDTDNELISLDEDDEEDDILIETDDTEFILIDEMFGDFAEYDLISSKKNKNHSSKNSSNKRVNSRSNSISSQSRSNSFSKSPKTATTNARRTRTISNSYSVRSGSSCSCCSEDMSEEEPHPVAPSSLPTTNKRSETIVSKHPQAKSISNGSHNSKPINKRPTSKLIKTDNAFIRKKNNGRFLMHKNTTF